MRNRIASTRFSSQPIFFPLALPRSSKSSDKGQGEREKGRKGEALNRFNRTEREKERGREGRTIIVFDSMRRHVRNFPYLGELLSHELDDGAFCYSPPCHLLMSRSRGVPAKAGTRSTTTNHPHGRASSGIQPPTPRPSCGIRRKF